MNGYVRAPPYVRHRPERTLLYLVVEDYYPPPLQAQFAVSGAVIPRYVSRSSKVTSRVAACRPVCIISLPITQALHALLGRYPSGEISTALQPNPNRLWSRETIALAI